MRSKLVLLFFSINLSIYAVDELRLDYKDLIKVCVISGAEICPLFTQSEDIIFDVGAHNGGWIDHAMKYNNFSEIYLFEPVPTLFNILKKNYNNNAKIHCYQIAMHNYVGEADFHINVTNEGKDTEGSSLYLTHAKLRDIPVKVITNTVDNFCDQNSISYIHFLKIDAEGADPYIIYGASNMISNQQIDFIQFEFSRGGYEIANVNFEDVYNFLITQNYILFYIDDRRLLLQTDPDPFVRYGDFLAVKKNLLDRLKMGSEENSKVVEQIKHFYKID